MSATWISRGAFHETSVPWGAGHADNDIGILSVEHGGGVVATPAGGWIPVVAVANAAGTTKLSIFINEATSGAMGNAGLAGGTDHMIGVIDVVRGSDLANVFSAIFTAFATAASVSGFAPGGYVPDDDVLVMHFLAWAIDDASDIASVWASPSLTGVAERGPSGGTVTGNGGGLSVATGSLAAGKVVIAPASNTLTSTTFACATLAIRSAPAAPAFSKSGIILIGGVTGDPAPDGGVVEIWDNVLKVRETTAVVAGGAGGFTANVKFNNANRYFATYDNGVDAPGVSVLWTAA